MGKGILFAAFLALGLMVTAHDHEICDGFVPENNMRIPVGDVQAYGVQESEFNDAITRAERIYAPIISRLGGNLRINRLWSNDTVNASANRSGRTWQVNMYGGLARHPAITQDGFTLVICHEIGHHIGGAPKINSWFGSWASNEGQSDYFASLKCMRKLFTDEENLNWVANNEVDPVARRICEERFSTQGDRAICMRSSMAAMSVSVLFQELREEEEGPKFDTPDPSTVSRTNDRHPQTQCRLDTYFSGAVCDRLDSDEVSQTDPSAGTCLRTRGYTVGVRPFCWYRP